MKHVLTIAARDLSSRLFVFVTAAIVAVLPFGILLSRRAGDAYTVIMAGGLIISCALTFGLAVALGSSIVTADLADRRMSFYFSKPISAAAIWFGKLAGALATIVLTFAIVFVPAYVAARSEWNAQFSSSMGFVVGWILTAAALLLLLMHALSSAVRSRSPLVALDLVLLAAAALAMSLVVLPLVRAFAMHLTKNLELIAFAAVPVAIAIGGAWQLSRGRTDIRRSHMELSRFFWIAIFATIAAIGVYVGWVVSAGPRDLLNPVLIASPRGDFAVVTGTARNRDDYAPHFLVNTRDGKWTRVPAMRWSGAQFSRSGNAVMFAEPVFEHLRVTPRTQIVVMTLDGAPHRVRTDATVPMWDPAVVVSDDLTRLATFSAEHTLSIYDLRSNALVGSARIPFGERGRMFFVSRDIVRVYVTADRGQLPDEMRIYEFDAVRKQLQQTGRVPYVPSAGAMRVSGDGSTAVVAAHGNARIFDARTGALRATIAPAPAPVALLADGGVAFVDSASVRIFDAHGAPLHVIPVGTPVLSPGVRELVPGRKLLVSVRRTIAALRSDLAVVDIPTGRIERVERNVSLGPSFAADPRVPAPRASDSVIMDANGALWRWNPLTGAKGKIL